MTRRKTDGQKISHHIYGYDRWEVADYLDRYIRRRMADAWGEGWFAAKWDKKHVDENPYRGGRRKK